MITASISYNHELWECSLKVEGHAGYDEEGKDIVCASASILAYTLAQMLSYFGERVEADVNLEIGNTTILCKCKDYRGFVKTVHAFNFAETGYQLLEHNYPQYVRLNA